MSIFGGGILLMAVYNAQIKKEGFHKDYIDYNSIQPIKDGYWFNTVLAYTAGMWYSNYRERLERKICASE